MYTRPRYLPLAISTLDRYPIMTSLFASQEGQLVADSKEPSWFQNSSKRVIPNHLVPKKKLGFQLSTVSNKKDSKSSSSISTTSKSGLFNATDFNVITFGNRRQGSSVGILGDTLTLLLNDHADSTTTLDNDDIPLYNNAEDLPPTRSLYDLNDEAFISLSKPAQHTESFINKDPRSFNNAFARKEEAAASSIEEEKKIKLNSLQNNDSAILVFGYPETMANQVIAYFLEFGTILENFEATKNSKQSSVNIFDSIATTGAFPSSDTPSFRSGATPPPPIFSGYSWVKLTYDNPSSAIDALQESGSVFNGVLIGVVPYTKEAVEKLQKRKLSAMEDIGGDVQAFGRADAGKTDTAVTVDGTDIQASYIKRLDIKDGSELFLKSAATNAAKLSQDSSNKKLGVWGTISNYFFGFHDL